MSPMIYQPPPQHTCEPPVWQKRVYSSTPGGTWHPRTEPTASLGSVWMCDSCATCWRVEGLIPGWRRLPATEAARYLKGYTS